MNIQISEKDAKLIAIAVFEDIYAYIEANRQAYEEFLIEYQQSHSQEENEK